MTKASTLGDEFRTALHVNEAQANEKAISLFAHELPEKILSMMETNKQAAGRGESQTSHTLTLSLPYDITKETIETMDGYKEIVEFCRKEDIRLLFDRGPEDDEGFRTPRVCIQLAHSFTPSEVSRPQEPERKPINSGKKLHFQWPLSWR